jgi:putative endonuclease
MLSGLVIMGAICFYPSHTGPIAQRLEQGTHNPLVPGSNPGGPSPDSFRGCHAGVRQLPDAGGLLRLNFMSGGPRLRVASQLMSRFSYVYILVSQVDPHVHYTGMTGDLFARLQEHNRGGCRHTAKCRPWRIETSIAFCSAAKARSFERYLKTGSGREFARHHF